jgi:hypothetical protein
MSRFAQGRFTLKNPAKYAGNRTPTYRSSWEFAFMKMCDENSAITQWASEAIRIPYKNPLSGKNTIYVPDFFIAYSDARGVQHVELIEVKPANQTFKEQLGKSRANQAHYIINQAKWGAARAWCKQKNITFRIINEGDMFHQGKRR